MFIILLNFLFSPYLHTSLNIPEHSSLHTLLFGLCSIVVNSRSVIDENAIRNAFLLYSGVLDLVASFRNPKSDVMMN